MHEDIRLGVSTLEMTQTQKNVRQAKIMNDDTLFF